MIKLRAALLAATLMVPATAFARPMTPEDVARLESVGAIDISPDGQRIAHTRSWLPDVTEGEENGSTKQQLQVSWGPQQSRDFLPDDMSVGGVEFSPNGNEISFTWTKSKEERAVWAIPVNGGAQAKLAEVEDAGVRSYSWAPDGTRLYMIAGAAEDKDREAESDAGFDAIVYEEEQRPNRLFAALVGSGVDKNPREIPVDGQIYSLTVTPDGKNGVAEIAPSTLVDDSYTSSKIKLIDLASGKALKEFPTTGKLGDYELSPDGKTVAIVAAVDKHDPAATTLYFGDLASGGLSAVSDAESEAVIDTAWTKAGELAAVIHQGASSLLRIYRADGSVSQNIPAGELTLNRVTADGGKIAVRGSSSRHPSELFVLNDTSFTRWTKHNPWLADIDFGKQRTMTYKARDGQEIEGILIEPVGGAKRGGSPTIMMVHGGPESHYSNGWLTSYSMPGQVGAGEGYAVFHPNYRGSTGYGVGFAKQHQADYAGKEFDDIVDAKHTLVSEGIADPKRTGITGGSYGGFATAWGSTYYSAEYAAGVMFVGISNNVSKFGTTDIPNEMYLVHERKWPWEEWDHLMERSPITHVDKAETPILIMHGAEDPRVSPTQSMELYRHIKTRKPDTPVRLVLYPGEGHGNQKAAARYDYNLRMMEWFDTYLKTGNRKAEMPPARPAIELEDAEKMEAEGN